MDGIFPVFAFHVNEQGNISFVGTNAETSTRSIWRRREWEGLDTARQLTDYGEALRRLGTGHR